MITIICTYHFSEKTRSTVHFKRHRQFTKIHTSSPIDIEKILNRTITKFYNSDDVNVIAPELRLTKTGSTSFYKKHNIW